MTLIANDSDHILKVSDLKGILLATHPDSTIALGLTSVQSLDGGALTDRTADKTRRVPTLYLLHHICRISSMTRPYYLLSPQYGAYDREHLRWASTNNYVDMGLMPILPENEDYPLPTAKMLYEAIYNYDPESEVYFGTFMELCRKPVLTKIVNCFNYPTLDHRPVMVLGERLCAWPEYQNIVIQGNELVMGKEKFLTAANERGFATKGTPAQLNKYKKIGR